VNKSKHTGIYILAIRRQAVGDVQVVDFFLRTEIKKSDFEKSWAKFGSRDASLVSLKKAMEDENRQLMQMYADLGSGFVLGS
jgi:hypothetical protein